MKRVIGKKQRFVVASAIFGSFLLFGFVSALFFAPIIKTNADSNANTKVKATVSPVVSLALDTNTMEFNITPTAAGAFNSQAVVATVNTNSTGGYELFFSSEDNTTTMTSLTSESTISSDFSGTVTSSTMAANKWGYSLDNTNFSIIPTLATPTKIKDLDHFPASNEKTTTVNIATKVDTNLPSGTYTKNVVFSAIAHPSLDPNINRLVDLTSMQDPNLSQYCEETYTPTKDATQLAWDQAFFGDLVPRASVKDSRDDKYYLISKLADGNCWMSQNLELALDSTEPLTNEKTDLNSKTSWTPEYSTLTEYPTSATWPTSNVNASAAARSYYPIVSDRYYQGGTYRSSTPTDSGVEYDWEKTGTYYNWYAATAGSGTFAMTSGDATDSICPKGWMLPPSTSNDNNSFYYLLTTKYNAAPADAVSSPLNFLRAGFLSFYDLTMRDRGSVGLLWTSTAHSEDRVYNFYSNSSNITSQDYCNKGYGFPIRCVAR